MVEVGWLSAVPYLAAIIAEIACSTWSDKTGKRIAATWPCFVVAALAFYGSYLSGRSQFLGQLCAAGDRGRRHVCALRTLLRVYSRHPAVQCRRAAPSP